MLDGLEAEQTQRSVAGDASLMGELTAQDNAIFECDAHILQQRMPRSDTKQLRSSEPAPYTDVRGKQGMGSQLIASCQICTMSELECAPH